MNAPQATATLQVPALHLLALSALQSGDESAGPEAAWLAAASSLVQVAQVGQLGHLGQVSEADLVSMNGAPSGRTLLQAWLDEPPVEDQLLHALARALPLRPPELIAVALAMAVEVDAMAARVVAWLQAPAGGSRPTVGLVLAAAEALGLDAPPAALLDGAARDVGLLQFDAEASALRPLPEQPLRVPLPLVLALRDGASRWPGVEMAAPAFDVAPSLHEAARQQALALRADAGNLIVRSGHPREARSAAAWIVRSLGAKPAFFEQDPAPGAGLWLALCGLVPVLCIELGPGESRRLPALPGYHGPMLVASGPEGSFSRDGDTVGSWRVPLPRPDERAALWQPLLGDEALAQRAGRQYRYDAARIAQIGRAARYQAGLAQAEEGVSEHTSQGDRSPSRPGAAQGTSGPSLRHVAAAARSGLAAELGALAELMSEPIADDVLIVPPPLRDALAALRQRCELREDLSDGLGASTRARYRPGVRALFVGPSGTGKTLAAGWLATQLGLPLYRVDVAAICSKYIGETEKNLAQLFARAEHAEVVLLFDEADSLFGKRTDVKESNDRFANAQTNYLLQRVESFEGIALLTSNSRGRFDSAFTRRLDVILDFPQPTPQERRALWVGHLGTGHALSDGELNRLATGCDLCGGHIRNIVLAAAARARHAGRAMHYGDALQAVAAECRKLGRQTPAGLAQEA